PHSTDPLVGGKQRLSSCMLICGVWEAAGAVPGCTRTAAVIVDDSPSALVACPVRMQIPPVTGGRPNPGTLVVSGFRGPRCPPQLSDRSSVPGVLLPRSKMLRLYCVVFGDAIDIGHEAFEPGAVKQPTPGSDRNIRGSVTNAVSTMTAPLP